MKIRSNLTVTDSDPLVREHRVQDIHILPGVSMLDAIYKTLASVDIQMQHIELSDIVFYEPVVTHDAMDRYLTVNIEIDDNVGIVKVTSVPTVQGVEQSTISTLHLTANMLRTEQLAMAPLDTMALVDARDLDLCYQVTRKVGIFHEDFMKCLGQVCYLPDGDILAQVRLGPRATEKADNFLLHPVFMDCATIVPLYYLADRLEQANLHIPFTIQGFKGSPLSGHTEVYIRVKRPDHNIEGKELLSHTFELYALDGSPIATFDRFSVKKVHSLGNIRQLLSSGESARNKTTTSVDTVAIANDEQGDPVVNWVIHHLVSSAEVEWQGSMIDTSFFDLGLDSLNLLDISEDMSEQLNVELYPTVLFEHSSVSAFAEYLTTTYPQELAELFNQATTPVQPVVNAPKPVASEQQQNTLSILAPRWSEVQLGEQRQYTGGVAIWSAQDQQPLSQALSTQLALKSEKVKLLSRAEDYRGESNLWLVNPTHFELFEFIKSLIDSGKIEKVKQVNLITFNAFELHDSAELDANHGVWGIIQSWSREYSGLKVCQLDMCQSQFSQLQQSIQSQWINRLIEVEPNQDVALYALRQGHFYQRKLLSCHNESSYVPPVKHQGVYVIIGGATGLGLAFSRYLRRCFDAKIAIVGRRSEAQLDGALAQLDGIGEQVIYQSCAVNDSEALAKAFRDIEARLGVINGIVHSAMVLDDKPLIDMDEHALAKVMAPKSEGIRSLAQVTEGMMLDFMLVFSSVQSLIGNASQANYAAASTYIDGYTNALAAKRDYPITVVNWGFWQDIGAVANDVHRQLMARQGMYGLVAQEAFTALMQSMANGWSQVAILSASDKVLVEMGWDKKHQLNGYINHSPMLRLSKAPIELEDQGDFSQHFTQAKVGMEQLIGLAQLCIGGVMAKANVVDLDSLTKQLENKTIVPEFKLLLETLVATLPEILAQGEFISFEQFTQEAERLLQQNSTIANFLPLLSACINNLFALVTGKISAAEVIFPNGSPQLVSKVYGQSEISLFYNKILAKAVLEQAQAHQCINNRPLRILEIGAGTGASCQQIIDLLGDIDYQYCYTDLWDQLVDQAKVRFSDPRFEFKILDIGTDPNLQGFEQSYDLIVATNVLHATPSLPTTLLHIKKLLLAQGTLLINESVDVQPFSTYTFGLLPGWWNSKDKFNRITGSPLATKTDWQRLLADIGFTGQCDRVVQDPLFASQVILQAQSDGVVWTSRANRNKGQSKLPAPLQGKLVAASPQQLTGIEMPALKHLQLYFDHNDNLWLFLDNAPANTFTLSLLTELCSLLEVLKSELDGKLLYVSHIGSYFSLGGDRPELMQYLANNEVDALTLFTNKARQLLTALVELPAMVVAVVNGSAQGGGLETLLATDLQLVSSSAKVGLPEIKSGLMPGMGGLSYLTEQVGMSRAKNLLMGGELISATQAQDCGLISHVVDDPFEAAIAMDATLTNRKTAVHIKQRLAPKQQALITSDLDDWLDYMLNKGEWIDSKRIDKAKMLIDVQANTRTINKEQNNSNLTIMEAQ